MLGGIDEFPRVPGDQPLQPRDLLRLLRQLSLQFRVFGSQLRVLLPQPRVRLLQRGNHIRRIRRIGHRGTTSRPALSKQIDTASRPATHSIRAYQAGLNAYGYDGGAEFVLTHSPPDPPDPAVTFLTGDIGEAVATALRAAGGKNLEILGADVAGQCLQRGLVDEILVYVLPVLLGDGIPFSSPPGLARIDLEPLDSTRSGAVTILRFRVRK